MAREQSRHRRDSLQNQNQNQQKHISEKDPFTSRSKIPSSVSTNDHQAASKALTKKKNNFPSGKFIGLGCKASSKVFVPSVIKTSANWEAKKFKKKNKGSNQEIAGEESDNGNCVDNNNNNIQSLSSSGLPDVWCSKKEGNDAAAAAASASSGGDCLLPRRHVFGRGKVDGEKTPHTKVLLDEAPEESLEMIKSPRIVIMQNRVAMERRLDDRYRDDWRLDIDHMSYEELLALSDRIGYVSTGLKEDEIQRCVTKLEPSIQEREKKCSICQEEYEANNEKGKLRCGHYFHMQCIKLWLKQKNSCPICKTEVLLKR